MAGKSKNPTELLEKPLHGNGKSKTVKSSRSVAPAVEADVNFHQVMEDSILSIIMIDENATIFYFNESAETLWGYSAKDIIGKDVKILAPPEVDILDDAYTGTSREVKVKAKDGSLIDILLTLSESNTKGRQVYTAIVQDFSEKKKLEAQLNEQLEEAQAQEEELKQNMEELAATQEEMQRRQAEVEHLKSAVDTGWASIEFQPDGIILSANENFVKTLGYESEDTIIGQHHRIFCESEYATSFEYKKFWSDLANGQIQSGEFRRLRKDGKAVWINASYTPVKDANGHVLKVIKIASDITEMVKARALGENVKSAVDTGWAYIEFGPDGAIVNANKNFTNTMGYTLSEIEGQHHRIFCSAEYTATPEYSKFWKDLASGITQTGEYQRVKKNGDTVWLQAAYTPVRNSKGEVVKVIKIAADISAVKVPVLEVCSIISDMAQGDLTRQFNNLSAEGYVKQMGEALNVAIENLSALLSTIDDSAQQVADAATSMKGRTDDMKNNTGEMASAISQMAKGAQDQAEKTDESSKLTEEVLKSATDMEEKSDIIYKAAETGVKSCGSGLNVIKELVSNMTGINDSAGLTSESIAILTERAEEIGRTLNVITDIAAQTNLLALNAAIEAARAGEAGRGFAVVAEEIRKLAEDSRKSAVDIEKIINDVQKDTQSATKAIDQMSSSVQNGSNATKEAEQLFQEISSSSEKTLELSKSIKDASGSQKASIDTVATNIEQIVVVAEETAAGTEEIATSSAALNTSMEDVATASNQLTQISQELKARVNRFNLKKQ